MGCGYHFCFMDEEFAVQRGKVTCPELVNARVNLQPCLHTFTILISAGALKHVIYCLLF